MVFEKWDGDELHKITNAASDADKASCAFFTADHPGALLEILQIFRDNNLNMSKLQSFSVPNTNFEYGFYVDLCFQKITDLKKHWSK